MMTSTPISYPYSTSLGHDASSDPTATIIPYTLYTCTPLDATHFMSPIHRDKNIPQANKYNPETVLLQITPTRPCIEVLHRVPKKGMGWLFEGFITI